MTTFDHNSFLNNTSESPGIYQMFDEQGDLLYVGKAKNLKKRLSSYFRKDLPIKTSTMMGKVVDIQINITHTENEALILESNLIKELKPRYNVLLRDSKSYPFIHIDDNHPFPRISKYRGDRKEAGRYFGPYPSASAVSETLGLLQKVLPVRQCEDTFFNNRARPCLQYQIKRCTAPCVGLIDEKIYNADVEMAALFLEGKDQSLNNMLQQNMEQSSKALKFEEAANWRDRISALRTVQSHQAITSSGHSEADIITMASLHGKFCIEVTYIRGGRHSGSKGYFPKVVLEITSAELLQTFISQYYDDRIIPKEIILAEPAAEQQSLAQVLSQQAGHKVTLVHRVRGVRKDWLNMAQLNVRERLKRQLADSQSISKRIDELTEVLQLEEPIQRIECFDISHTQGKQTVASCVVFTEAGMLKSDYRRYNINDITPGDDYAAMRQAILRRYKRLVAEEARLPDVLLIDGGKGQLSSAAEIIHELQLPEILLVGVAKGEGRKPGLETLFIEGRKIGIQLDAQSAAMHLVQQIRDEAHRFAITGHRARRGKAQTRSVLQEIPGVGNKRRQALLKHFGGLQGLQKAGVKDIAKVEGISLKLADDIYRFLQN